MSEHTHDWLWQSPQFLKGIGPKRAEELKQRGIEDVYDLLHYLPRSYRDLRHTATFATAPANVELAFQATILNKPKRPFRRAPWRIQVEDSSGIAELVWFTPKLPGPAQELEPGQTIWILGKLDPRRTVPTLAHPRLFRDVKRMQIEALYRGLPWLSTAMPKAIQALLPQLTQCDLLPRIIQKQLQLLPWQEAFLEIHAPGDTHPLEQIFLQRSEGYRRLMADTFMIYGLGMALQHRYWKQHPATPYHVDPAMQQILVNTLPFTLTNDQQQALQEIWADLRKTVPMYRMVQGDVGSGKTAVALIAAAAVAKSGGQVALLAPTEILAAQHAQFFDQVLADQHLRIGLLTGGTHTQQRQLTIAQLENGNLDIVIGTHALLQTNITFARLSLVIIDEEQRYGVAQRMALRSKGASPHTLLLSATPIPRSLALGLLGENDVSIIREKPKDRAPVVTKIIAPQEKRQVLQHIQNELLAGHKIFFLYPRIEDGEEDSDKTKSVIEMHAKLADFFGKDKVGLLHGRMSSKDKNLALQHLRNGKTPILVATTVIEVGVDVPDATILVIGQPELLGLSQLHQLRGRIGRGKLPGTCYLLLDDTPADTTLARLDVLTKTTDGFEIAEADLELRGPGSLVGTRQSGIPDIHPALLRRFAHMAKQIRAIADDILNHDPHLLAPQNQLLRAVLLKKWDFPTLE